MNLSKGQTFEVKGEKYNVLDCFYKGTFSTVYKIQSNKDLEQLVMKVESKKGYGNSRAVLKLDAILLEELSNERGFAMIRQAARTENCKFIIMKYVGPDLFTLKQNMPNEAFTLRTVLHIALQILDRLEVLHRRGWLHRDLKPGNMAVGEDNLIYLLDFGMARRFLNDGKIRNLREVGPYCGTCEYTSLASSYFQDMGPNDDLESFFYVIMHFLKGQLPWSGVKSASLSRDIKTWVEAERTSDLFGGISARWEEIYSLIIGANSTTQLIPKIREKVKKIIEEEKVNMKKPLDWQTNSALLKLFQVSNVQKAKEPLVDRQQIPA